MVETEVKVNIMRRKGNRANRIQEAEDEVVDEVVGQTTRMSNVINVAGMVTMQRTAIRTNVLIVARSGISQEIVMPRRK